MEQAAKPRSGRAGVELAPAATRRNLEIRTAQDADIPAIVDLARRVYPGQLPYSTGQIRGQIRLFRLADVALDANLEGATARKGTEPCGQRHTHAIVDAIVHER